MTKEQAKKRFWAKRYRRFFWEHDWCLCRQCAPRRWEKFRLARAVYVEPR